MSVRHQHGQHVQSVQHSLAPDTIPMYLFYIFQFFVSSIWHKQTYQPINTPFVDNLEGSNLANWCNACCTDVMQVNCSLIAHRSKLCTRHTDVLY